jgi:hypothetical protein
VGGKIWDFVTIFCEDQTFKISYKQPFECDWEWYGPVTDEQAQMLMAWKNLSAENMAQLIDSLPANGVTEPNNLIYATGNFTDVILFQSSPTKKLNVHGAFVPHPSRALFRAEAKSLGLPVWDITFFRPNEKQNNNVSTIW